jgi:uncharacterized membrane protein HdeD (DUF308 family)
MFSKLKEIYLFNEAQRGSEEAKRELLKILFERYKNKTKFWLFIGMILKYIGIIGVGLFPLETLNVYRVLLFLLSLVGFYLYINGCASYAKLKGYRRAVGFLLGFFTDIIGLFVLILLPDRHTEADLDFLTPEGKEFFGMK